MARNNYSDNTDINIYFHMKNHYKKLRNARSTIDNTLPQSFNKMTCSTPPNSVRSFRSNFHERNVDNNPHLPLHSGSVKKHNCITTSLESGTSNTSLNTVHLPPRCRSAIPLEMKYLPTRSHSMDLTRRKGTNTKLNTTKKKRKHVGGKYNTENNKSESVLNKIDNVVTDNQLSIEEAEKSYRSITSKESVEKCNNKHSNVEEHEYLQFLLRITEDIIINNLYTNEDIENVFQTHVEANKDHLNIEKMEAQLARLCIELDIPYKNNSGNYECYENFFNSESSDHSQILAGLDCECTKKRTLDIETKVDIENFERQNEENNELSFQKLCNILTDKCSLGQVTECTESSGPMDALIGCMKQFSNTSVQSSEHNILSCLKNMGIDNEYSRESLHSNNMILDAEENINCDDDNLTEKEKIGCMEEEILFHKLTSNLTSQIEYTSTNEPKNLNPENDKAANGNNEKSVADMPITNIAEQNVISPAINKGNEKAEIYLNILDNPNELAQNISSSSIKNNDNCGVEFFDKVRNVEQTDDDSCFSQKYSENQINCAANTLFPMQDIIQNNQESIVTAKDECISCHRNTKQSKSVSCYDTKDNACTTENIKVVKESVTLKSNYELPENIPKISTNDQCTQMKVASSDKECNTSIVINDYHKSDYVLLNGPIYVLKTVLNSEDKLIVYDKEKIVKNGDKEIETTLSDEKIEPVHCDTTPKPRAQPNLDFVPSYMQEDFSRLLSSDYDLMPQRDSNTSDKYHHLLVDAATSISNVGLNKMVNTFTNPNALLLSDEYELINKFHKEQTPETDNITNHSFLKRNNLHSENGLHMDARYQLRNSLSNEVNSPLNISDSADNRSETSIHEHVPGLGVSLTDYEILSQNSIKESDVSKDISESGEILRASTCTDEELSQISTCRSDNERTCNNLSPNRNILGKRKLKHPL